MSKDDLWNLVTEQAKSIGMLEVNAKIQAKTVDKLVAVVKSHSDLFLKIKSSFKAGLVTALAVFIVATLLAAVIQGGPAGLQQWLTFFK